MPLPDTFPRADRKREYFKDKDLEITVLSECLEGMWRPRFVYQFTIARRVYRDAWVGHDVLFAVKEDCNRFALLKCIEAIDGSITWAEASKALKAQFASYKSTLIMNSIDHKHITIWHKQ